MKRGWTTILVPVAAALLFVVASCEDNITNVTIARDSMPEVCPDSVRTRYCVWSERAHSWVCLDAPLPEEPPDRDDIISRGEKAR